jgi:hypothetical protein
MTTYQRNELDMTTYQRNELVIVLGLVHYLMIVCSLFNGWRFSWCLLLFYPIIGITKATIALQNPNG